MCPNCGKYFESTRADHYFCCNSCATSWWRQNNRKAPKVELTCPVCGKAFIRMNGKQKYCSKRCMQKAWKLRNPEKAKANWMKHSALRTASKIKTVKCVVCGKEFLTVGVANTCSPECHRRHKSNLAMKYYYENQAKQLPKELGPLSCRQRSQIITGLRNALKYFNPDTPIEEVLNQIEAEDINYKWYSIYDNFS